MAYPTGSGSEVLKRTSIHNQSNSTTSFRWDGTMATTGTSSYQVPALHIITVLSIVIQESGDAAEQINMWMNEGTNNINLLNQQPIGALETFVWNEKLVLMGGDYLYMNCINTANVDIICSYIDQDWT